MTWRCSTESVKPGATASIRATTPVGVRLELGACGSAFQVCGTHWVNIDTTCWPSGASESSNTLGMQMSANGSVAGCAVTASWNALSMSSSDSASTIVPPCTCGSNSGVAGELRQPVDARG